MPTPRVDTDAPPPDMDHEAPGAEWAMVRPTTCADDTCDDLLRAIEKGQHAPLLLRHLSECQAPLPALHCQMLGLADGATYADAVRALSAA